jgi:hypothetical protein
MQLARLVFARRSARPATHQKPIGVLYRPGFAVKPPGKYRLASPLHGALHLRHVFPYHDNLVAKRKIQYTNTIAQKRPTAMLCQQTHTAKRYALFLNQPI